MSARSLATAGDDSTRSDREVRAASCSGEFTGAARGRPDAAQRVRDQLVELHLPLVEHLARRFRNRGEPLDDLVQVGTIGLIKAVDRFDTERGVEFSTYATPTVVGEIKRHFRDKGWAVRVPRRLQELRPRWPRPRPSCRRTRAARRPSPSSPSTWRSARRRSSRASSRPTPTRPSRWTPATARDDAVRWRTRSAPRTRRWRAWSTASRSSRCSTRCRPASGGSCCSGSSGT